MNSFERITRAVNLEWVKVSQNELVKYILQDKLSEQQKNSLAYNLVFLETEIKNTLMKLEALATDHIQESFVHEIITIYSSCLEQKHYLKQLASQKDFDKNVFKIVEKITRILITTCAKGKYWESFVQVAFLLIVPYEQIKNATGHLNKEFIKSSNNPLGGEWIGGYDSSKYRAIYAKVLNNIKGNLPLGNIDINIFSSLETLLVSYLRFLNHSFINYDSLSK